MTIAMDELDVAFLAATGAPLWQPLGTGAPSDGETQRSTATADDGWTAIVWQFEMDRVWDDLVATLDGER
jgi:hypothetical protein